CVPPRGGTPHSCGSEKFFSKPSGGYAGTGVLWIRLLLVFVLFTSSLMCPAQPKSGLRLPQPLDPVEAEQKGRALVADLMAQKPAQNSTNTGVLKIRDSEGTRHEMSISFEIRSGSDDWLNSYQTSGSQNIPGEKLEIIHSESRPNQYLLSKIAHGESASGSPQKLAGEQTMIPFAGSDFW